MTINMMGYCCRRVACESRVKDSARRRVRWLACFINFPLNDKLSKLPLQKGRADVAVLTTGGDTSLPKPETKRNEICHAVTLTKRHSSDQNFFHWQATLLQHP